MNETDTLRLFDLSLARELVAFDRDELFRFVESREEELRSNDRRRSVFVVGPNWPKHRTTPIVFGEFFEYDPADVRQTLIIDLCYPGEPFEVNYHARCGYLDHPSSVYLDPADPWPLAAAPAINSYELLPWPDDSEAWDQASRFDVLDRSHIELMSDALRKHRKKIETEEYTAQLLALRSLSKTLASDPGLRAAYEYQL
jgi:hypothetical protein